MIGDQPVSCYDPIVEPLLNIFGIKPGDNVTKVVITIEAGQLIKVDGERYATWDEIVEFTKYLQLHSTLKEENQ